MGGSPWDGNGDWVPTRPYVFLTGMIEAVSQRHGNNTVAVGIFARGNKA